MFKQDFPSLQAILLLGNSMLKGELGTFSLGEVFQSLAINNHSGTLKITPRSGPPKLIYFDRGQITLFSMGGAAGARIGDLLIRLGKITPEQLSEALEEQKETHALLGSVLIKKGFVSEDDLRRALEKKTREEICDLFLWQEGSFEFHLDYFPDDQLDEIQKTARIALDVNAVTMEGLRQLDEWSEIHKTVKTFNEIFVATKGRPAGDDPLAAYLVSRCDGATPVKEILKSAPGSKFEGSKKLHELVGAGQLRPVTLEELRVHAENRLTNQKCLAAVPFLQFAVELEPEDGELHLELGRALAGSYQEEPASRVYLAAARIFFAKGDHKRTAEAGERIVRRTVLTDENVEMLLHCHLSLGNAKKAAVLGHQLVSSLEKTGDYRKAATVTEAIAAIHPGDLNLRIQTATLLDKAGDRQGALLHLEPLVRDLEKQRRFRELGKVLRLMLDLDPSRQDLKTRIGDLQQLQERYAKRKRRMWTGAVGGTIAAVVLCLVPILYQIKAAAALGHAERLEELAEMTHDYSEAKKGYEAVLVRFSLSGKATQAKAALERISQLEARLRAEAEAEALKRKRQQDEKLDAMKEAVAEALKEAAAAMEAGDLETTHEIYRRIKQDYSELSLTRELKFPLRINSYPAGATISIDGRDVGQTPFLFYYHPGTDIQISLKRTSCEPLTGKVTLTDQWELNFALHRSPLANFLVVMTIEQPIVVAQGLLFVASRDGVLYALDPSRKTVSWQRSVGRFGDRTSNLATHGGNVYLGTASAELAAIDARTGGSRWVSRVGGSVLAAPAISADGAWVAVGTTKGTVEVLDNKTGYLIAKFATENEVLSSPVFVGDLVVAGSTDNALYGYSMSEKRLVFMEELDADVFLDLGLQAQTVFFATRDGEVHAYDCAAHKLLWSEKAWGNDESASALTLDGGLVFVGTTMGNLVALDASSGATKWKTSLGKDLVSGMRARRGKVYLSMESGRLVAIDVATQTAVWQYRSDTSLLSAPTIHDNVIYFGGVSGRIWSLELIE